jgi:polyhydroxyalkanoate synthesis regulator protein
MFERTFSMFKPFVPSRGGNSSASEPAKEPEPDANGNIDDLRRQMKDMQDRLDRMSKEPNSE